MKWRKETLKSVTLESRKNGRIARQCCFHLHLGDFIVLITGRGWEDRVWSQTTWIQILYLKNPICDLRNRNIFLCFSFLICKIRILRVSRLFTKVKWVNICKYLDTLCIECYLFVNNRNTSMFRCSGTQGNK